jgi:CubicO group peptidase (beta-lactamase class C family)
MTDLYTYGFPPLPETSFPPCGTNPTCTREQLFEGLAKLPPSFAPFTTPVYSDLGFVLLSFIAERITGKSYKTLVTDSILTPLNLTNTFVNVPHDSVGIIPGTKRATLWGFELGEESPYVFWPLALLMLTNPSTERGTCTPLPEICQPLGGQSFGPRFSSPP